MAYLPVLQPSNLSIFTPELKTALLPASKHPPSPSISSSESLSFTSEISLRILQKQLAEAVRAPRKGHSRVSSFITLFDDDDTGAQNDADKLQSTLKDLLGIESTVFKIPASNKKPHRNLQNKLSSHINEKHRPEPNLHTLLIFTYIGHGTRGGLPRKHEPHFTAKSGKSIRWSQILGSFLRKKQMDVLAILDCCHAGVELSRQKETGPQTIAIMAACGSREWALARCSDIGCTTVSHNTFTQRLCTELIQAAAPDGTPITVDALYQNIRDNTSEDLPNPRLIYSSGIRPIMISFKPCLIQGSQSSKSEPHNVDILVRATLTDSKEKSLEDFRNFLLKTPSPFKIQLVDAWKTDDFVILLMRMSGMTMARLSSTVDIERIGIILGVAYSQAQS